MRYRFAFLFVALSALWGAGCGGSEVLCGEPFAERIIEFQVTTTTGDEATDMDIHFCYLRRSGGSWSCKNMDTTANNFERGMVETFYVPVNPPIEVGDLESMRIKNVGGGFLDYSWDMKALMVEAKLEGGQIHLLFEQTWLNAFNMRKDEAYTQSSCVF